MDKRAPNDALPVDLEREAALNGQQASLPQHHALIAGTGRAGTSFLVRYLANLGLDTEINRSGQIGWNDDAQAGLESLPIATPTRRLPYVIKAPWAAEFIDEIFARKEIIFDVAIIPMRDLTAAACSRIIVERRNIHESAPWMAKFDKPWEAWGTTPGGATYSLEPLDQARLLAVGFHNLVHKLVAADIPIVLLDFPKIVYDWKYLFEKVRDSLPFDVTLQKAEEAHHKASDVTKVRVEAEIASAHVDGSTMDSTARIAMARELARLRNERDELRKELSTVRRRQGRLTSWLIGR